ncbi:MAG: ATP-grasp domain-containing protein [Bacteroidales bacterium]|nr:ATP-grasp domain-containing protein [Bacteroidales bacterium]
MKKAIVLINQLSEHPTEDELDVLDQACIIEESLEHLGYQSERMFMTLNIHSVAQQLKQKEPEFVVNLVESLEQDARLIHWAPALLEHLNIPFTGCSAQSMFLTSNKVLTKEWLRSNNLPTADWFVFDEQNHRDSNKKYIAKPLWEDASVGITDANVLVNRKKDIRNFLSNKPIKDWFLEAYIPGREFNVSVLGGKNGPTVLPLAEIIFENYPEDKPSIVGYEAKWKEDSFEYKHTVRSFGAETTDPALSENIKKICTDCWHRMELKGYARIDFRIDKNLKPYVLEINANPCLSPDAGFYAAAQQAGLTFDEVLNHIIFDALNQ